MHLRPLARVVAVLVAVSLLGAGSRRAAAEKFDDPIRPPGFWFKLDYNWDGSLAKGYHRGYANLTILSNLRSAKTLAQAKTQELAWLKKHGYRLDKQLTTTVDGKTAWMIPASKRAYNERWGEVEGDRMHTERKSAGQELMVYVAIVFMTTKGATGYFIETTPDAPLLEVINPILQETHIQ